MPTNIREREVKFFFQDGCLVRTAVGRRRGRTYIHRCQKQMFETVAHAIEETPDEGEGTSLEEISSRENLPFTQVNVALEYLKERGIVEVRHRRCYPASRMVHLDAMVEFHALAEEPRPE